MIKKSAEVRWRASHEASQQDAAPNQDAALQQGTAERKPACSHGDILKTVVYKSNVPFCTVIAVGIGIYMLLIDLSVSAKQQQHHARKEHAPQPVV